MTTTDANYRQEMAMSEDVFVELNRLARVLAVHQIEAHGMTHDSPDRCTCGKRLFPAPGSEEAGVRRRRAFAEHQAAQVMFSDFVPRIALGTGQAGDERNG